MVCFKILRIWKRAKSIYLHRKKYKWLLRRDSLSHSSKEQYKKQEQYKWNHIEIFFKPVKLVSTATQDLVKQCIEEVVGKGALRLIVHEWIGIISINGNLTISIIKANAENYKGNSISGNLPLDTFVLVRKHMCLRLFIEVLLVIKKTRKNPHIYQ